MKNLRIFVAISLLLAAGCNRPEAEDPVTPEKPKGKYELKELTATLPEADTKTELDNQTKVVRWKAGDRIMVIASDGTQKQYLLDAGEETSVGKFVPLNTPVTFDEASELRAVSPACAVAGDVSGSDIPLRINSDRSEDYRFYGISSWNNDATRCSFSLNDIKVALGTGTVNNSSVNFKFTQLVTVCDIILDFTNADKYDLDYSVSDYIKKIQISGVDGISGTATWNSSTGTLSAGNENTIEWNLVSPKDMRYPQTLRFLMYPQVTTASTLSIQVTTDRHFFNFTGRPDLNFASGSYYKLPISVDRNFTIGGGKLAYTVVDMATIPLYYYGNVNCYLKPKEDGSPQTFNIDVTPHATDAVYHNYDIYKAGDTSKAPAIDANGSAVVWKEAGITTLELGEITNNSLPVTVEGNGNAVVAIKDGDGNILWSYHIWVPNDTPIDLEYPVTNSYDTYYVMSMPLGATKVVTALSNDSDKADGSGLYYQWGRKDPMGRPNNITATNGGDLRTTTPLNLKDSSNEVWFTTEKSGSLEDEFNNTYLSTTSDNPKKTIDRYMIDYSIEHPERFINASGDDAGNWTGVNVNTLWGNANPGLFPRLSKIYKSIFDPCPKGYFVAPSDTWINFTRTNTSTNQVEEFNQVGNYDKGGTYYINRWQTGDTDFYPASGARSRNSGNVVSVGLVGYSWSSNCVSGGKVQAYTLYFSANEIFPMSQNVRATGFPIRCVKEP